MNIDQILEETAAYQEAMNGHFLKEEREDCPPEYPCPDILWQGPFAEVADIVGFRDWRVWLGTAAALSARAHRNIHVDYHGDLYGMGYYLLVAPSSHGKSACTKICKALLPEQYEVFTSVESGQALAESLALIIRDKKGKITDALTHPAALVMSEWSMLLKNMDFHGSSLLERMLDIFDAERQIDLNRADKAGKGKIRIKDPTLTLCGTTTEQAYRDEVKPYHVSSGFINRHLILPNQRIRWQFDSPTVKLDLAGLRAYADRLPRARTFGLGEIMPEMYTTEAYQICNVWGARFFAPINDAAPEDERAQSPYARLHVYFRKIALLYAWATGSSRILTDHVKAAIVVIETSHRFLRQLHDNMTVSLPPFMQAAADIEEKILALVSAEPGIKKDTLCNRLRRHGGYSHISEAVEKLIQAGALLVVQEGTRNKKHCLFLAE